MSELRFTVQAADLWGAITRVATIGSGGLVVVVEGDRATLHARGTHCAAAAPVPIGRAVGRGAFVVPAKRALAVQHLSGPIEVAARSAPTPSVRIARHDFTTTPPDAVDLLPLSLASPVKRAPAALLAYGIDVVRGHLASRRTSPHYDCVQLFDATTTMKESGNGTLYGSDKIGVTYFQSPALRDMPMCVPKGTVRSLLAWLQGTRALVGVTNDEAGWTYISTADDEVFGFAPSSARIDRLAYYSLRHDGHVLRASKDDLLRALMFIRAAVDRDLSRVTLRYRHEPRTLQVMATEGRLNDVRSPLVRVFPIEEPDTGAGRLGTKADFVVHAKINHLIEMVSPLVQEEVVLRLAFYEDEGWMMPWLRTIEDVYVDARGRAWGSPPRSGASYPCKVTRFRPGLRLPK